MARALPRLDLRRLLTTLLALGLVLRLGMGCEAMAATPTALATHQSHCVDMTGKPGKPTKAVPSACALCVTTSDAARETLTITIPTETCLAMTASLGPSGLAGGPAPPPPRVG